MKTKTSELIGIALDWAVARLQNPFLYDSHIINALIRGNSDFGYSTNWAEGGPLSERESLCVGHKHQADPEYCPVNDPATNCWARTTAGGYLSYGPTPLVAAMRCYCCANLGDEIDIPEELCQSQNS